MKTSPPLRVALLGDLGSVHVPRLRDALKDRGVAVQAFSLEPFSGEGEWIPPRVSRPRQLRYLATAWRLRRSLQRHRPQVIVAVSLANYGLMAWIAKLRPLYLMLWGSDLLFSARKTPVHRAVAKRILRHATRLNVDSLDMVHDLVQVWHIPPERVDVFTWGLPRLWFSPLPEKPSPPPWRVVTTRRLDPDMDPLTVIDGVARAVARGLDLHVDIVGDGVLRDAVVRRIRAHHLQHRVTLHGWLDPPAIRDILDRAHIYVAAPLIDSTSVSLLEAMARGALPVVSDLPANREWLIHAYTGFLFPAGQPDLLAAGLVWAAHQAPTSARSINRQVVEHRASWERHVDQLVRVLNHLALSSEGS